MIIQSSQACVNATMDVMAANGLLRSVIEASQILGVNQDKIPSVILSPYFHSAIDSAFTPLYQILITHNQRIMKIIQSE